MTPRNCLGQALVIQCGSPSAVINQALAGMIVASRDFSSRIQRVLGAAHGLHGVLHENFYDLSSMPPSIWQDIGSSPGAALGSTRMVVSAVDYERIFSVFMVHNIKYVFFSGGRDAAKAALELACASAEFGYEVNVLHVPETIDNDLVHTDHTPGYGSVARVVSHLIAGDDLDNRSFYNGIKINVTMGRHSGWVAAATALARSPDSDIADNEERGPHLIYVPEVSFDEHNFIEDVQDVYNRLGRATIVVSEGIAQQVPSLRVEDSEDGQPQFSGSAALGEHLARLVKEKLRVRRELGSLRVRTDTWGYVQRSLPTMLSPVDQSETFWAGAQAVRYAMQGAHGCMVALRRSMVPDYRCETELVPLEQVTAGIRYLPRCMLNPAGNGVSREFYEYALPLAAILPKVRVLHAQMIPKQLPAIPTAT